MTKYTLHHLIFLLFCFSQLDEIQSRAIFCTDSDEVSSKPFASNEARLKSNKRADSAFICIFPYQEYYRNEKKDFLRLNTWKK